jgi:hypothetical protein
MESLRYLEGGKNAALLSPCHSQISLPVAAFYAVASARVCARSFLMWMARLIVLALFFRAAMFFS